MDFHYVSLGTKNTPMHNMLNKSYFLIEQGKYSQHKLFSTRARII